MRLVTMMAFITRCCKNKWLEQALRALVMGLMLVLAGVCQAQSSSEIAQYQVERQDDDIVVSAQLVFELPNTVEDALLKGIPMFFIAETSVLRERWYWYDKNIVSVKRHLRLEYRQLTRRWRLNVTTGSARDGNLGLALNQNFDTLEEALAAIKRVSRWKIADVSEFESGIKYRVDFGFKLDLSQLPRPLQIGALGHSDWDIAATASTTLSLVTLK